MNAYEDVYKIRNLLKEIGTYSLMDLVRSRGLEIAEQTQDDHEQEQGWNASPVLPYAKAPPHLLLCLVFRVGVMKKSAIHIFADDSALAQQPRPQRLCDILAALKEDNTSPGSICLQEIEGMCDITRVFVGACSHLVPSEEDFTVSPHFQFIGSLSEIIQGQVTTRCMKQCDSSTQSYKIIVANAALEESGYKSDVPLPTYILYLYTLDSAMQPTVTTQQSPANSQPLPSTDCNVDGAVQLTLKVPLTPQDVELLTRFKDQYNFLYTMRNFGAAYQAFLETEIIRNIWGVLGIGGITKHAVSNQSGLIMKGTDVVEASKVLSVGTFKNHDGVIKKARRYHNRLAQLQATNLSGTDKRFLNVWNVFKDRPWNNPLPTIHQQNAGLGNLTAVEEDALNMNLKTLIGLMPAKVD
ncbi:hypothetical protein K474DRAFT_1665042 [Panus rudis PR-1116 ss-1]|nr:hypothetical protein K474DRAFT_1665042 [Panus rudis PR-1116 ss-1]